jgi:hypothetical protein
MGMTRAGKAHGAHSGVGHVQVIAEQIDNVEADFAVLVQEVHEVLAVDLGDLYRIEGLGGDLVAATGEGGAQAENLPG